jgi:hypothetical protein
MRYNIFQAIKLLKEAQETLQTKKNVLLSLLLLL